MILPQKSVLKLLVFVGICTLCENDEILKIFQDFYENVWKIFLSKNGKCENHEKHDFEKVLPHVGTGKSVFLIFTENIEISLDFMK